MGSVSEACNWGGSFKRTIEIRAVGVDGRDSRDRRFECWFQGRLVRYLVETLERNKRPQSKLLGVLDPTLTAAIHSLRSSSEIDLHSRLTRGSTQWLAYTVVTSVRRRVRNMFFLRLTAILSDRCRRRKYVGRERESETSSRSSYV